MNQAKNGINSNGTVGDKRPLTVPLATIPLTVHPAKRHKPSVASVSDAKGSNTLSSAKPTMVSSTAALSAKKAIATKTPSNYGSKRSTKTPPSKSNSKSSSTENETDETLDTMPPTPMPNIYDAMLGEISDLISAAQEAQACGRLKMASTYQLLVHARLVGLGKRFDRFLSTDQVIRKAIQEESNSTNTTNKNLISNSTNNMNTTDTSVTATTGQSLPKSSPGESIRTAQAALAKILPSEVNLDYTMMEHLARAAMELHNRRTGRGMLHEKEMEKKQNAAMALAGSTTPIKTNTTTASVLSGVAWSSMEKQKCIKAIEMYGKDGISNIAKTVGRTEAEVKAHLKTIDGMKRVKQDLDVNSMNGASTPPPFSMSKQAVGSKQQSAINASTDAPGSPEGTPDKKKSRGKKSPPRAMLTVPNTTFDAKRMLFEPI